MSGEQFVPPPADKSADSSASTERIEVFVDGGWCPGELRRVKVVDGVEVHTVHYVDVHGQTLLDNFPAGLVRRSETDPGHAP